MTLPFSAATICPPNWLAAINGFRKSSICLDLLPCANAGGEVRTTKANANTATRFTFLIVLRTYLKRNRLPVLESNNSRNDLSYAPLQFPIVGDRRADGDFSRLDR